jgi:Reverse transcriptase (RNA-dependent DNA polymerase)
MLSRSQRYNLNIDVLLIMYYVHGLVVKGLPMIWDSSLGSPLHGFPTGYGPCSLTLSLHPNYNLIMELWCVYVGFEDGAKAVKYYNSETCTVLTSHNFYHINPPGHPSPSEHIEITPDQPCEGESGDSMQPPGGDQNIPACDASKGPDDLIQGPIDLPHGTWKWKRKDDAIEVNVDELWRTWGICTDYRYLQDPFHDEKEDETFLTIDEVYAIIAGDELNSLKKAKDSIEWPEWEWAMQEQLDLLKEMGTWETMQKPPDAIPIANKWVFMKKHNNLGEVVHYKARLVAKGCAQHPGHDYMETSSPVVWMDTLHAILVLIPIKGLKVQQMDVKGMYLNGTLQETIYMWQPEGCEDGTGQVCRLLKLLYSLKQAWCEWNNELDNKLKIHKYQHLFSDPCAYVRHDGNELGILTVWVDDSLLFASSDDMMDHMMETLHSEWKVTDLDEPRKIISIEVTCTNNAISISQEKYIENILCKEGMLNANPVGMPMDPNIKLVPNSDDNEFNHSNSYAKLLGSLQFVANSTRPDISYTINKLAAYTAKPGLQHHGTIKQILWYLAGTKC